MSSAYAGSVAAPATIVIIGAPVAGDGGVHGFFHGTRALAAMLAQSPVFAGKARVIAAPFGWPKPEVLESASVIVLYEAGRGTHPLCDRMARAQLARLIAHGVGIVALHGAASPAATDLSPVSADWLGGTVGPEGETSIVVGRPSPAAGSLTRGVGAIRYLDGVRSVPHLLPGAVPVLAVEQSAIDAPDTVHTAAPIRSVAAWAYRRPTGGRSFVFTGMHDARQLDVASLRTLILNGIAWVAGFDIPAGGVTTDAGALTATLAVDPHYGKPAFSVAAVVPESKAQRVPQDWGTIIWYTSGALGNSDVLTTGTAIIDVGKANPRHFHPNCDEVLHVVSGHIRHSMNGTTVEMGPGDTISIPRGTLHNATNIGRNPAILSISFNTAWREVVGE